MGQYYKVVNITKKQYITPWTFGDGSKLMEFGNNGMGTMTGLAILLSSGNGLGGGDLNSDDPIIGSWAGDKIVIAGDYADKGLFTRGNKNNLYDKADKGGYKDISARVLYAMMDDSLLAQEYPTSKLKDDIIAIKEAKSVKDLPTLIGSMKREEGEALLGELIGES